MGIIWLLVILAIIIIAYKLTSKRLERQRLERRRGKVSRELEREEELAPLHAEIAEKEGRLVELKAKRRGGGQAKSTYGKTKKTLGDLGKAYNSFRRFIGVDTTKSKF